VRVCRFFEMPNCPFRDDKRSARVDLVHESNRFISVETTGVSEMHWRYDHDIDAAEVRRGLVERLLDVTSSRTSTTREGPCRRRVRSLRGSVDRAGKFRMRLRRLRRDRHVGAIAGGAQPDRQPDARDAPVMNRVFSSKRHGQPHFLRAKNAWNAARASSDCRSCA